MMQEILSIARADGVTTLSMDDGKANVMSVAMLQALHQAFEAAQRHGDLVLLQGRAGMFSGGFDLNVFKRSPAEAVQMLTEGARLAERMLSYPHPVLAVATGHAVAMGLFVLLSADWRIGIDQGARFHAIEVQIGMTLPRFATEVCRQRLSPAAMQRAALTAAPHTPAQALEAGMLDELAPADALPAAVQAQVARLKALDAKAFTATKQRLRAQTLAALRQAITDDIAEWQTRIGGQR
jgi:enoyl-CoA hydratase